MRRETKKIIIIIKELISVVTDGPDEKNFLKKKKNPS